jgi:hypothetical protein
MVMEYAITLAELVWPEGERTAPLAGVRFVPCGARASGWYLSAWLTDGSFRETFFDADGCSTGRARYSENAAFEALALFVNSKRKAA